jgi:predicted Zn-dependent protease
MHDQAVNSTSKAVELAPRATLFLGFLGEVSGAADRRREAEKILNQLLKLPKEQYVSPYIIARIYMTLGNSDEALTWLEAAFHERASLMVLLKTDPRFDELRSEPRFQALIQGMKFPAAV